MAFKPTNFTPIGGNSRSGIELSENAPMGWAYASETDNVAAVLAAGYFDTINKIVGQHQFIYASLTDNNVIFTIDSVDRQLQQVTLSNSFMQPVPDGIVTANPQTGVTNRIPVFSGNSALVIKDSGININDVWLTPNQVTPVFVLSDFGTVTATITLDVTEKFMVNNRVVVTVPMLGANPVSTPPFPTNSFDSSFLLTNRLEFSPASSVMLTLDNQVSFAFENMAIFDISNGITNKGSSSLIAMDGGDFSAFSICVAENYDFRNFASIGTFLNMNTVRFLNGACINAGGTTFEDVASIIYQNGEFRNNADEGDTFLNVTGEIDLFFNVSNTSFNVKSTEAAIFIDPNIGADSVVVIENIRNLLFGNGKFFKSGSTGDITSIVDTSATFSVTLVGDGGAGKIVVDTSIGSGFFIGMDVTLSSMTVGSYDGTFEVLSVPTPSAVVLGVAFAGSATGTLDTNTVTITSAAHGLSNLQTLLVIGTVNYNGGAKIYNALTNTYQINRTFVSAETVGTWDTGSLTGTDKRVTVSEVQGVPNSKTIFSLSIQDGSETTLIATQSTYQDLKLEPTEIDLNGTELFSLIDPVAGVFRYDGVENKTIMLSGLITGIASEGGASFITLEFRIAVDDVLSDVLPISSINISQNTNGTAPISGAVVMSPGSEIQLKVRNTTNDNDIIIQQMSFIGE